MKSLQVLAAAAAVLAGVSLVQSQATKPVAKQLLVKTLPGTVKGIQLKNGAFTVAPGFRFVPQSPHVVGLAQNDGPVVGTFSCACIKTTEGSTPEQEARGGSCKPNMTEHGIECEVAEGCAGCLLSLQEGKSNLRLAIY
jgi:hypothetical protein